jgi:carbon-monoxide dehydrogenase small subunit
MTGTKQGCGAGLCGCCTVMVEGMAVKSCLILALQVRGKSVQTIEGLAKEDVLDPVQEAFIEKGAIQCGYCSAGMIMSSKALLQEKPQPSESQVRHALSGNLCRCTGYHKIVKAVMSAGQK